MEKLNKLRQDINSIDLEIISLIKRRFDVVKEIGKIKKADKLPIKSVSREGQLITLLTSRAKKAKIPEELVMTIWKALFKAAYDLEKE